MSDEARGRVPAAVPRPGASFLGAVAAEIVGTFVLVFFGVGAVIAVFVAAGELPPGIAEAMIALSFGFGILAAVYAFGHVSGAHINPTVTLGLAAVGRFPWAAVPAYLAAQFVGGLLASLAHWALFGEMARADPILLGATVPGERGAGIALLAEILLGFLLVVVILGTATDERAVPAGAGLAIGLTIAAGIFVTLRISGGSFNAARSLPPMIIAGQFPGWWVYLVGPALGGVLGAFCYDYLVRSGAPPD